MVSPEDTTWGGQERRVFEDRWNFFSQKREEEDPGRGKTQGGLLR